MVEQERMRMIMKEDKENFEKYVSEYIYNHGDKYFYSEDEESLRNAAIRNYYGFV